MNLSKGKGALGAVRAALDLLKALNVCVGKIDDTDAAIGDSIIVDITRIYPIPTSFISMMLAPNLPDDWLDKVREMKKELRDKEEAVMSQDSMRSRRVTSQGTISAGRILRAMEEARPFILVFYTKLSELEMQNASR